VDGIEDERLSALFTDPVRLQARENPTNAPFDFRDVVGERGWGVTLD
jgi:hypothetical protein